MEYKSCTGTLVRTYLDFKGRKAGVLGVANGVGAILRLGRVEGNRVGHDDALQIIHAADDDVGEVVPLGARVAEAFLVCDADVDVAQLGVKETGAGAGTVGSVAGGDVNGVVNQTLARERVKVSQPSAEGLYRVPVVDHVGRRQEAGHDGVGQQRTQKGGRCRRGNRRVHPEAAQTAFVAGEQLDHGPRNRLGATHAPELAVTDKRPRAKRDEDAGKLRVAKVVPETLEVLQNAVMKLKKGKRRLRVAHLIAAVVTSVQKRAAAHHLLKHVRVLARYKVVRGVGQLLPGGPVRRNGDGAADAALNGQLAHFHDQPVVLEKLLALATERVQRTLAQIPDSLVRHDRLRII
ncbi:type II secretion system protein M [Babesia caballi]|uniref:Type II secretion system protein M n=1 Tax=Babesia caballi TaxID=5871 RepID=A0AAV4M1L1_BABCB|nr:type II secretion system protein M [Babesia caballi]